jgi:hypothetical protein
MLDSFVWTNITVINDLTRRLEDCIQTKILPRAALQKLVAKKDLLTKVTEISFNFLTEDETTGWMPLAEELVAAVAPRLESVRLRGDMSELRITQRFIENCDSSKLKRLNLTDYAEHILQLARTGLPNVHDLNIIFQEDEPFQEFAALLRKASGNLRHVQIYHDWCDGILSPQHVAPVLVGIKDIVEANPHIVKFKYDWGGRETDAATDLCFLHQGDGNLGPEDWRSFPSKCLETTGLPMEKFMISGDTFWNTFYCKEMAEEFVRLGPEAAQFLWEACGLHEADFMTKYSDASGAISTVVLMDQDAPEASERLRFCRWAFEKLSSDPNLSSRGDRVLKLYGHMLMLPLDQKERSSILALAAQRIRDSGKHPLVILQEQSIEGPTDGPLISISACMSPESFSSPPTFEDAEEEASWARHFLTYPARFEYLFNHPNFDPRSYRLGCSGKLLVEVLAFALLNDKFVVAPVRFGKVLFPILDSMNLVLDISKLERLRFHVAQLLNDDLILELLGRILSNYSPLLPHLTSLYDVKTSRVATLLKSIQKRLTGSETLPEAAADRLLESSWNIMAFSYRSDPNELNERLDETLAIRSAIPEKVIASLQTVPLSTSFIQTPQERLYNALKKRGLI